MSLLRNASLLLAATAVSLASAGPARAASPVEQGSFDGVDGTFSGFLSGRCGFPVTVTDHERDTFVDNGHVSIVSIHITADVVGNGRHLTLHTNSPLITKGGRQQTVGQVVQVRDEANRLLAQLSGQLRVEEDPNGVFHGHFPELELCDFLQ